MSEIIRIDARILSFADEPMRVLSVCFADTGDVLVQKVEAFTTKPVSKEHASDTIIITDAPQIIEGWDIAFDQRHQLEEAISIFQMRKRAGMLEIDPSMRRYDPTQVLQVRKVDKNGMQTEFDSSSLTNGHGAVLLSVWASQRIALAHSISPMEKTETDNFDMTMMPFSI
ncbi:hypothetical protein F965_00482 [Acinetobacter schindleri NIPH 900]|uniref:Uncharacterized protein n=1 Tax=Acinetobacter schindleri NIPH 900 TaxID=1217675 RepID=N8XYV1_9GAMM|nr:hypothetical protein [Acinetobacter schindleri]ENV14239.1 hypothetical protein F965_00482 [Acinetobacter schindleri NIPH 900]